MNNKTSFNINNAQQPLVAVIGASGFIGQHLIPELLAKTNYRVRAVARDVSKLTLTHERLEVRSGDVNSAESMGECLKNASLVFFFAHSLESRASDLVGNETAAAKEFAQVAQKTGVKRVIYLSGLGQDGDTLSRHLTSRHRTGDIFREHIGEVIEFRAGIIVGQGSLSFEIIRYLVRYLPILIMPKQAKTLTHPIRIADVLQYLLSSIDLPLAKSEIIEIGGPEKITYQELLKRYARFLEKKRLIITSSLMSLWLASWCLYLFTPRHLGTHGRNMVESFQNEMIVTNQKAEQLFPDITPKAIEDSFF